jgi:hypothetical protein
MIESEMKQPELEMIDNLKKFAEIVSRKYTKYEVIQSAVAECKAMMHADAVALFLVKQKPNSLSLQLTMEGCAGYDKVENFPKKPGNNSCIPEVCYELAKKDPGDKLGLTAQIALKKKPVLIRNRAEFSKQEEYGATKIGDKPLGKFDKMLWKEPESCKSFVGVPLLFSEECIGILKVEKKKDNFYNDYHKAFISTMGVILAAALNSCKFHLVLGNATKELATTRHEIEIMQVLVRQCAQICCAEACSIFLYDNSLGGLILRADHGHDINLSNLEYAPNDHGKKIIYSEDTGGLTWKCFKKDKVIVKENQQDIPLGLLWPYQWNDTEKKCHSIFHYPIRTKKEGEKNNRCLGVLKLENKKQISGLPVESGGFTDQDKFIIELFSSTIGMLLRESYLDYGKPYSPAQLFGEPVLKMIQDVVDKLSKSQDEGKLIANKLNEFCTEMDQRKADFRTIMDYSNSVIHTATHIGEVFGLADITKKLLTGLQDYEIVLKNIPKYRHHFVHQFNVFLLGLCIIMKNEAIRNKLKAKNPQFLRDWFLTSMFHDVGLPVEKLHAAFQGFIKTSLHVSEHVSIPSIPYTIVSIEEYHRVYEDLRKAMVEALQFKMASCDANEIRKKAEEVIHLFAHPSGKDPYLHNHSFISAAMLLRELLKTKIPQNDASRIVTAILFHEVSLHQTFYVAIKGNKNHITIVERALSLENNPLLYLLGICDTIQNWGRPEAGGFITSAAFDDSISITVVDFKADNEKIMVQLNYSKEPKNWPEICDKIIKPQTENWKRCDKTPEIEVQFRNGEDGGLMEKGISDIKFRFDPKIK